MRTRTRTRTMNGRKTSIIVSAKAIASQNLAEDKSHPSVRPSVRVAHAWRESIKIKISFLGAAQLRSRARACGRPTDRPPTALWWESRAQSSHKKAVRYGNAMLASWPNLYRTFSNHFWYFALLKNSCEPSNVFEF